MMTHDTLALMLAWGAGGLLGAFFFGGLWWTVRQSLASAKPALWVFGSLLVRMGVTMAGFYAASGGDWQRSLACMVGFVMARQLVTRLTRPPQEASHAP